MAVDKPAHTFYQVRNYYDLFIVGQARLGIDTQLGDSLSFSPMVTGQGYLAAATWGSPIPSNSRPVREPTATGSAVRRRYRREP